MPTGGSPHPEDFASKRQREAPEAMRIRLLGDFEVSAGTRTIASSTWRLRKAAGLVKLLALAEGHRLHRERAMELLWPGSGGRAASNNLRGTLHAARKALGESGPDHLTSEDGTLLLCPHGELWVDTEVFAEAASAARRSRNPAAYRMAIDLYAGELLPEDRFEDWAEEGRADLRRMYLGLLTELAGLYQEQGEHDRAVEALQNLLAEDPTEEGAHASLMHLYALSGRQGEALAQYGRLREVLSVRLDAEPSAETVRLRGDIADGTFTRDLAAVTTPERTTGTVNHNLPIFTTSFVDRDREKLKAKRELAMTRLLTLIGPGGSGKTRLALEVAHELVGAYPNGVWLVPLAPLSEPGLVVQEVVGVLGVQERPGESVLDALVEEFRSKQALIVLDNCEHLLDGVALLMEELLRSCPKLRLLATSREALGVPGEIVRPVPPLSLPDPGTTTVEELEDYGAVRLFVERALYRPAAFALTPENAGAVAEVCRQLEGIPLAIELAAARVGVLAVEQISERLSASLKVLTGGGRTLTSRQRTLRGSLDWSHALLSEPEKGLFARLSVFAGGWTFEAAEAVCSGEGVDREEVLDLLGALGGKSLVVARMDAHGAMRYRMLEIIRQYAAEKLEENGEAQRTQGRHAAFFLALAEEAEPEMVGPRQGLWTERLETEHDNLRAALSWALDRGEGGLRFGGALWRFWYNRRYLSEGIGWLERVLAGGDPAAPIRVKALEGMGWLLQDKGDLDQAETTYDEMLKLSRNLDDRESLATALNSLGILAVTRGDNERARVLLEGNLSVLERLKQASAATTLKRYHAYNLMGILAINEEDYAKGATLWEGSLALAREVGDAYYIGITLCNLGWAAVIRGDYDQAMALTEEALALAHSLECKGGDFLAETVVNMGLAALNQGDHGRASDSFLKALAAARREGRQATVINVLEGMTGLSAAREADVRAARLWGAAEAAREATGIALPPGDLALHEPYLASARSRLGEAAWEEALSEGRAMSLDEAAEYALEQGNAPPTAPTPEEPIMGEPAGNLSRREREVAVLVSRGLTNRQVSTELSISERTAGNHVARILRKLDLGSRTQIATWAAERGLLGSEQG
jgi:predicted ATPase/DNA-binding SARP family transcriptional activator/DNA-binding CsgD family transcriptional regulator